MASLVSRAARSVFSASGCGSVSQMIRSTVASRQFSDDITPPQRSSDTACINEIRLMGRLGRDPVTLSNGAASFSLCTNIRYNSEYSQVDWHRVEVKMDHRPEMKNFVLNHLRQGDKVYVSGTSRSGSYLDDQGTRKYFNHVRATKLMVVHKKSVSRNVEMETEEHDVSDMGNTEEWRQ